MAKRANACDKKKPVARAVKVQRTMTQLNDEHDLTVRSSDEIYSSYEL